MKRQNIDCYPVRNHHVFGRWFPSDQERTLELRPLRRSSLAFRHKEMVPSDKRFVCVRFYAHAMGVDFNWTLNQEMLFSFALTGKPSRKEVFGEYHWRYCVIGTREDYVMATAHNEWVTALKHKQH